MKYLLDTHALLWWLGGNSISSEAYDIIANPKNKIFISSVSSWEIVIKKSLGKLNAPDNLAQAISVNNFIELPITISHTLIVANLALYHQDPFDRLLIAQATYEQLPIISRDIIFSQYNIQLIKA